jgi:hypothetical protein
LWISPRFARAQTDIEIARSATVWELKVAIENLFSDLYDDAQKTISWYASPHTHALP